MEERNEPLYKAILKLLEKDEHYRVTQVLSTVHPADAAEIIEALPDEEQREVFELWDADHSADALLEMSEAEQVEIAESLSLTVITEILNEMPVDDAADLLGDLPVDRARQIISLMNPEAKADVESLLKHHEETAGGLMTPEYIAFDLDTTADEAINTLRKLKPPATETYYIFVTGDEKKLTGVVSLRDLIIAAPNTVIKDLMNKNVVHVKTTADQEEAARLIRKYDLLALPVVDEESRLVGMITVDDIIDVIQEEATEDMYRMIGLSAEEKVSNPIKVSLKRRLPWLYVNLITAVISASVVSFFEPTIAKFAVLAVFMPIVANQGGVGGTQVATILVRGLALGELDKNMARRAIFKELSMGVLNGVAIGLAIAVLAFFWKGIPALGLIVGAAMLLNLIAASFAGMTVPLTLRKLGVDPAIASSIFVTMVTDAFAFLFVLGLATLFIAWLI